MNPSALRNRSQFVRPLAEAPSHPNPSTNVPSLPHGWHEKSIETPEGVQHGYMHAASGRFYKDRPGPLPPGWSEVVKKMGHETLRTNDKVVYYQYGRTSHQQLGRPSTNLPPGWAEGMIEHAGKRIYGLQNVQTKQVLYERPSSEEEFQLQSAHYEKLVKASEERAQELAERVSASERPEAQEKALVHLERLAQYIEFFKKEQVRSNDSVDEEHYSWPIKGIPREQWLGQEVSAGPNNNQKITRVSGEIEEFKAHKNEALMAAAAHYIYDHHINNRDSSTASELSPEKQKELDCLQEYLFATCKRLSLSGLNLLHVLAYFEAMQKGLKENYPTGKGSFESMIRMLLVSMMIENKKNGDDTYSNKSWGMVHRSGVEATKKFMSIDSQHNRVPMINEMPLKEINQIESEAFSYLGFIMRGKKKFTLERTEYEIPEKPPKPGNLTMTDEGLQETDGLQEPMNFLRSFIEKMSDRKEENDSDESDATVELASPEETTVPVSAATEIQSSDRSYVYASATEW